MGPLLAAAMPPALRHPARTARLAQPPRLRRRPNAKAAGAARAEQQRSTGGSPKDYLDKYLAASAKVPPAATFAALPVVGLSLLCKALTGHGLPGAALGSVEGVAWLVAVAGAGGFAPYAGELAKSGDFSVDNLKAVLVDGKTFSGFGEDATGRDATERIASLGKKVDPNSALGMQLKDLEERKAKRATKSDEELEAAKARNKAIAAAALGVGQTISDTDEATAEREKLLAQPVTETLKNCMTTENYDVDVTKFDDSALGDKLNLSSPEIQKGAPTNNPGDKWREAYKQKSA